MWVYGERHIFVLGASHMALAPTSAPCPRTRRALLGSALALGTALAFPPAASLVTAAQSEKMTGPWRTWLLTSGDELRPPPPALPTPDELAELVELRGQRTAATLATIAKWDDPTVVLPWTTLTLDLIRVHTPNPVRAARALALLHVALYDTLVATDDARMAFPRPGPADDGAIVPLGRTPGSSSSFPSEHAAVAAAAATVLTYLFPDEPADALKSLADEAALSRLTAGRAFRTDVEAGKAIGRAVGERAVARGKADGSD